MEPGVDYTWAHTQRRHSNFMKRHLSLGRQGAGAQERRAHARRVLLVLIGITRRLARLQTGADARAACREIEAELRALLRERTAQERRRKR